MPTGRTDPLPPESPGIARRTETLNCTQVPAFGNCAGHVTVAVAERAAAVTKLRASAFGHVDEMPMRSQLSSTCRELERVVTRVLPRDFCDFLRRRRRRRDLWQNARSPSFSALSNNNH